MTRGRLAGLLAAVLALLSLGQGPRVAAGTDYPDAVDQALRILRDAPADDRGAARQAAAVLESGTGERQREILDDLRREPPDVPDARDRLTALSRALHAPVFAPEPGRAQRSVHDILGQPRYAALREGPSIGQLISEALGRGLLWILARLASLAERPLLLPLVVIALVPLLVAVIAVVRVVRAARWGGPREISLDRARAGVQPPPDRFAEADRLAAAGDLAGAVRQLAGGVAAALGDERVWESSPLTVREIFARAADPPALRPLLTAFELAAYGGRAPDRELYRLADAAATGFRPGRAGEAAG